DEIRFDISANRYSIEKIKFAAGKIPVITVEIPAVPEDLALLKEKSIDMVSEGVNHLNLHQLRLTPYNFHKLTGRDYTFLHGTRVTVLDSEMAALEMIRYTTEKSLDLPVNYCSFVYKNRYQALAARNRYAPLMQSQWEHKSSSGYLRSVFLPGDMKDASSTLLARYGDKLLSSGSNIHITDPGFLEATRLSEPVTLVYNKVTLKQKLSYYFPFKEVRLSSGMKVYLEKQPVFRQSFASGSILSAFLGGKTSKLSKINQVAGDFETMPTGLADYF
ncbi:MAG TPA: hypothetical protein VE870_05225, partial [Bacteroidales bacterium]|nr:hypothetical protein [Bacteroidales bacterium]